MRFRVSMSMISILIVAVMAPLLFAADTSLQQDRMWAHFDRTVKFADKLLPAGEYLVVHDDALKVVGEPCLYVYRGSEQLVAVHCIRKARRETEYDRVAWKKTATGPKHVEFVQFAGDAYAHYLQ